MTTSRDDKTVFGLDPFNPKTKQPWRSTWPWQATEIKNEAEDEKWSNDLFAAEQFYLQSSWVALFWNRLEYTDLKALFAQYSVFET